MKFRTLILMFMILAFLGTQVGCGKKAPPVAPRKPQEKLESQDFPAK